jgi:hypothetical protein
MGNCLQIGVSNSTCAASYRSGTFRRPVPALFRAPHTAAAATVWPPDQPPHPNPTLEPDPDSGMEPTMEQVMGMEMGMGMRMGMGMGVAKGILAVLVMRSWSTLRLTLSWSLTGRRTRSGCHWARAAQSWWA